jgi:hypothetical protein
MTRRIPFLINPIKQLAIFYKRYCCSVRAPCIVALCVRLVSVHAAPVEPHIDNHLFGIGCIVAYASSVPSVAGMSPITIAEPRPTRQCLALQQRLETLVAMSCTSTPMPHVCRWSITQSNTVYCALQCITDCTVVHASVVVVSHSVEETPDAGLFNYNRHDFMFTVWANEHKDYVFIDFAH